MWGARGSVVGWDGILQAGRSRVRFPMRSFDFSFGIINPSTRAMALGSTQPLTEMSTRNLPGGKGRPARKANIFTAICEPIFQPRRLTTLWAFTACYRNSFTLPQCGLLKRRAFGDQFCSLRLQLSHRRKRYRPKSSFLVLSRYWSWWRCFCRDRYTERAISARIGLDGHKFSTPHIVTITKLQ
jgi:hypothetical protein